MSSDVSREAPLLGLFCQPGGKPPHWILHQVHEFQQALQNYYFVDKSTFESFWLLFYTDLSLAGQRGVLGDLSRLRVKLTFANPGERTINRRMTALLQVFSITNDQFLQQHPAGFCTLNAEELAKEYGDIGRFVFEQRWTVALNQDYSQALIEGVQMSR